VPDGAIRTKQEPRSTAITGIEPLRRIYKDKFDLGKLRLRNLGGVRRDADRNA
jgi:hypothetical protein